MVARSLGFRLRRWSGSHLTTIIVLAAVIAAVAAAVLAVAAGARRTQTAPDRYQQAFGGGHDLALTQNEGAPSTDLVAALPAVDAVESVTFLFFGGRIPGSDEFFDALPFAGEVGGFEARVVEGREPDPGSIHEFVSTEAIQRQSGMSIGDTARFFSQTPESGDAHGFDVDHLDGPQWDAELRASRCSRSRRRSSCSPTSCATAASTTRRR